MAVKLKAAVSDVPSWMKHGKAAKAAMEKDQERAQSAGSSVWRYWLKPGGTGDITFLDGDLDEDGFWGVQNPTVMEHRLKISGERAEFVCLAEDGLCPICESGDKPVLVAGFTIIDHVPYHSEKTKQTYKDRVKWFVPTRKAMDLLITIAQKRGGLAGCRFDVKRTGEKVPAVGDFFDFTSKGDASELAKKYGAELVDHVAEFQKRHRTEKQLREMGFGAATVIGAEGGSVIKNDENIEDVL